MAVNKTTTFRTVVLWTWTSRNPDFNLLKLCGELRKCLLDPMKLEQSCRGSPWIQKFIAFDTPPPPRRLEAATAAEVLQLSGRLRSIKYSRVGFYNVQRSKILLSFCHSGVLSAAWWQNIFTDFYFNITKYIFRQLQHYHVSCEFLLYKCNHSL